MWKQKFETQSYWNYLFFGFTFGSEVPFIFLAPLKRNVFKVLCKLLSIIFSFTFTKTTHLASGFFSVIPLHSPTQHQLQPTKKILCILRISVHVAWRCIYHTNITIFLIWIFYGDSGLWIQFTMFDQNQSLWWGSKRL